MPLYVFNIEIVIVNLEYYTEKVNWKVVCKFGADLREVIGIKNISHFFILSTFSRSNGTIYN